MPRHVGIVACSAEGAALCYRTFCSEAAATLGEHFHPQVSLHNTCLGDYMKPIRAGDWHSVAVLMIDSAKRLASIGAQLFICPDNTIHQSFDLVAAQSPGRWLHIAEEVVNEGKRLGARRLGILGTRYLMEGPVYGDKAARAGLDWHTPDAETRERINQIIFGELVNGVFSSAARDYFHGVIDRLKADGCDAVVLGCTEIPLIVDPSRSGLPTLDSTRILARAALREALR